MTSWRKTGKPLLSDIHRAVDKAVDSTDGFFPFAVLFA
jgi:hypothetical protein